MNATSTLTLHSLTLPAPILRYDVNTHSAGWIPAFVLGNDGGTGMTEAGSTMEQLPYYTVIELIFIMTMVRMAAGNVA